mmetsp:Transcript_417/g.1189  ORF Transcript_417/g.1189 Transcript_417/m.1189 type:complete len:387 (+) Transcript_417:51-1211(+)
MAAFTVSNSSDSFCLLYNSLVQIVLLEVLLVGVIVALSSTGLSNVRAVHRWIGDRQQSVVVTTHNAVHRDVAEGTAIDRGHECEAVGKVDEEAIGVVLSSAPSSVGSRGESESTDQLIESGSGRKVRVAGLSEAMDHHLCALHQVLLVEAENARLREVDGCQQGFTGRIDVVDENIDANRCVVSLDEDLVDDHAVHVRERQPHRTVEVLDDALEAVKGAWRVDTTMSILSKEIGQQRGVSLLEVGHNRVRSGPHQRRVDTLHLGAQNGVALLVLDVLEGLLEGEADGSARRPLHLTTEARVAVALIFLRGITVESTVRKALALSVHTVGVVVVLRELLALPLGLAGFTCADNGESDAREQEQEKCCRNLHCFSFFLSLMRTKEDVG